MRRIVTAITAAALALSLVAQAGPAAAVTGYDSAYAGESAFLTLTQGATGSFTVFFANTGSTTWLRGGSTQVDLAACLENKTTCNAQDASEAPFNSGWLSATRYTAQTQGLVGPGQIGTFTYNVEVPDDAAAGTYRFNGALVLSATGADIHNEGYFQDVTVTVPPPPPTPGAATLEALDPEEGSIEGGENVVITGEDIVCTPEPTVNFGDNEADVLSCGETTLTVETPPADEADTVDVTVTNAGADASNALPFVYVDDVAPTFDAVSVAGQVVTLTFSEGVCVSGGALDAEAEFLVRVNGDTTDVDSAEFADCDDDETAATATVTIADPIIVEGDTVSVTITNDGADLVEDAAGNTMERGHTESTTAEADETAPTITDAEATEHNELVLTADEPLDAASCDDSEAAFTFHREDDEDFVATDIDCDEDEITLTFDDATFSDPDAAEGSIEYDEDDGTITDVAGNALESFELDITPLEAAGDPTITSAQATRTVLVSSADTTDVVTLAFSEEMSPDTEDLNDPDTFGGPAVRIRVQDADGSVANIACSGTDSDDDDDTLDAECSWNDDYDELSLRLIDSDDLLDTGDSPGLSWPATIVDASGLEDVEGNPVDLENSDDVNINGVTDNTAPTVTSIRSDSGDDTIDLVMSEPVTDSTDATENGSLTNCDDIEADSFEWTDADNDSTDADAVDCQADRTGDGGDGLMRIELTFPGGTLDDGEGKLEYDGRTVVGGCDPGECFIQDWSGNALADFEEEIEPD